MVDDLQQIRNTLKHKRADLPKQEQKDRSALIASHIMQLPEYQQAKHIGIYLPVLGEADPRFLRSENSDPQKKFYLPTLSPEKNKHLWFIRWDENTQFKENIYGIPEPNPEKQNCLDAHSLDIVIMPLLGFDLSGNRLGMGGGYYDRTFSFKLSNENSPSPLLIAYAYRFQQLSHIEARTWDVPVDVLATEYGCKIIN